MSDVYDSMLLKTMELYKERIKELEIEYKKARGRVLISAVKAGLPVSEGVAERTKTLYETNTIQGS